MSLRNSQASEVKSLLLRFLEQLEVSSDRPGTSSCSLQFALYFVSDGPEEIQEEHSTATGLTVESIPVSEPTFVKKLSVGFAGRLSRWAKCCRCFGIRA